MSNSAVLINLKGVSQSYGATGRRGDHRATETLPTKAAVVGIIGACQGRPRGSDMSDLAGLRMYCRVDSPGHVETDFQTFHKPDKVSVEISGVVSAEKVVRKLGSGQLSHRDNLADAAFVVALMGDSKVIDDVVEALRHPVYVPYLGRKANVPSLPLLGAVLDDVDSDDAVIAALSEYKWLGYGMCWEERIRCRVVFDAGYRPRLGKAHGVVGGRRADVTVSVPNPHYRPAGKRVVTNDKGGDSFFAAVADAAEGSDEQFENR